MTDLQIGTLAIGLMLAGIYFGMHIGVALILPGENKLAGSYGSHGHLALIAGGVGENQSLGPDHVAVGVEANHCAGLARRANRP